MHVITHARILEATEKWLQVATALDGWYRIIKANDPKDFADMKRYFPAVDKAGKFHVEKMKVLAKNGDGLNSYIMRNVKKLYD